MLLGIDPIRNEARANKISTSDKIRDQLAEMGIQLKIDGKGRTTFQPILN